MSLSLVRSSAFPSGRRHHHLFQLSFFLTAGAHQRKAKAARTEKKSLCAVLNLSRTRGTSSSNRPAHNKSRQIYFLCYVFCTFSREMN
jgi:hypothetical protein